MAFHPIPLGTYVYETARDRELVILFASIGHPELHPSQLEVSEGRWWTLEEIDTAIGKQIITPNFEQELPRIRQQLLALL